MFLVAEYRGGVRDSTADSIETAPPTASRSPRVASWEHCIGDYYQGTSRIMVGSKDHR